MEYVYIGKYLNTYALKGEIRVSIDTDFIKERYKKGSKVYLLKDDVYHPFVVERYREYKGDLIVKFKDINDINDIEMYKGLDLYKAKADISPLKDGEYYFSDLIGLAVYDQDVMVGKVIEVTEGPAYNFIRIQKVDGIVRLVPFIGHFIEKVDLEDRYIRIRTVEGLL